MKIKKENLNMPVLKSFLRKIKKNQSSIIKIFSLFLAWRVIVWLVAFLTANRFNLGKDQAFGWIVDNPWLPQVPNFLAYFARWDSGWYLSVASKGYYFLGFDEPSNIVFFPLYPLLMKVLGDLTGGAYLIAGMIISTLALLAACFFLFYLTKLEFRSKDLALTAVFFCLIFPYSFFLISVYTEGLFLLTILGSFYFARRKKFLPASIFALLASAARPTGIIMFPILIFEYFEGNNFKFKKTKFNILWILLAPLGLGSFMLYLYLKFQDPLLFSKAQISWGRETAISFWGYLGTFRTYLHDLFDFSLENKAYYISNGLDFLFFVCFVVLSFFVFFKVRKSYGLFMILSLLIPSLTESYISIGRFTAVLFPAFILLAKLSKKQPFGYIITILFAMLSTVIITLFVNSYWAG